MLLTFYLGLLSTVYFVDLESDIVVLMDADIPAIVVMVL